MVFPSLTSLKHSKILIFKTVLPKVSLLPNVSLKFGYFELGHDYDVTVTSLLRFWYFFKYVCKEENLRYGMYQLHVSGGSIFKFTGWCPSSLVKLCYKNNNKTKQNKKNKQTTSKQTKTSLVWRGEVFFSSLELQMDVLPTN